MRWTDSTHIDAPAARVWQLTLDVERWPALMPTMQTVEVLDGGGPLQVGSRARIKQPGQTAAIWTVTELDPERRFVWQSRRPGMLLVASHQIEPDDGVGDAGNGGSGHGIGENGDTACTNTLTLEATGPFAAVVGRLLGHRLAAVLATENACFTRAAEGATA